MIQAEWDRQREEDMQAEKIWDKQHQEEFSAEPRGGLLGKRRDALSEVIPGRYGDIELDPLFDSFSDMLEGMVYSRPLSPAEPKEIKHVVLDADETIWHIKPWSVASIVAPIGKTSADKLPVRRWRGKKKASGHVKLDPTLRATLKDLKARGIGVSIASTNDKKSVVALLDAFGLTDQFTDIEADSFTPKNKMVRDIAKRNNVDTEQIMFVNDSFHNIQDVEHCTDAMALIMGYNVAKISDILEYIK